MDNNDDNNNLFRVTIPTGNMTTLTVLQHSALSSYVGQLESRASLIAREGR